MDACHFLLGRPWKYDRKVMHDGGKNTYTFWKDGLKVILLPLKDEEKMRIWCQKESLLRKQRQQYSIIH
jgi:hypothetical protein